MAPSKLSGALGVTLTGAEASQLACSRPSSRHTEAVEPPDVLGTLTSGCPLKLLLPPGPDPARPWAKATQLQCRRLKGTPPGRSPWPPRGSPSAVRYLQPLQRVTVLSASGEDASPGAGWRALSRAPRVPQRPPEQ